MLMLLMMMMTMFNMSGYYREAPVVVLRGPQPHQQQAHQHQAHQQQHQQVSCSSSDLEAMEAKKSKEKGPRGLV